MCTSQDAGALAGRLGEDAVMEVLSSRILLRPSDLARSQAFYGDVLGLAVYREFGPPERPGVVFFLGSGLLEVSGQSEEPPVGLALRGAGAGRRCAARAACDRRRDGHTAAPTGAMGTGRDVDRRSRRPPNRSRRSPRRPSAPPRHTLNRRQTQTPGDA